MRTARRISQIFFLLLFLFLFFRARYPYEGHPPVDAFLQASPLAAVATMISSRAFIYEGIVGLVILALTIPLGRFFCGWICPIGTVIDGSDNLIQRKGRKPRQRDSLKFRSWKFAILTVTIVASVFSLQLVWFFDPIALLTRTLTLVLYPGFAFLTNGIFSLAFAAGLFEDQVYGVLDFAQKTILPITQPRFYEAAVVAGIFFGILALGMVSRRFWCRNLCPLGALLGIFSKFRLTRRYVSEACNKCSVCQSSCRMNAIEDDYSVNNTVECIECADCVSVCKPHAVSYKLGKNTGSNEIDLSRRRLIQASMAGVAGLALIKTTTISRNKSGAAIRPPGALAEDQFLDRCIRCQECVRICGSTGACLQPSLLEAGWEGIWSPISIPRLGYCEYNCNLCGQVCPTDAIQNLSLERKQKLRMGTAYFDKSRCIPWYCQEDCLVCEEHCPLPDKAIKFDVREARGPDGTMRTVKFPYVVEDLCIGCGICETKCPVTGSAGIFVTAAKEERVQAAR
jgi:polyferredoxin